MTNVISLDSVRKPVRGTITTGLEGPLNQEAIALDGYYFIGSMVQKVGPVDDLLDVYYSLEGDLTVVSAIDGIATRPWRAAWLCPEGNYWNSAAYLVQEELISKRALNL
jgi:hypothetical protein